MQSPQRSFVRENIQRVSPYKPTFGSPNRSSPKKRKSPACVDRSMTLNEYLDSKKRKPTSTNSKIHIASPNERPAIRNNVSMIRSPVHPNSIVAGRNRPTKINTTVCSPDAKSSITAKSASITPKPSSAADPKIRVFVRKRPLNKKEISLAEQDIAPLSGSRTIEIHAPKQKVDLTNYINHHSFIFDDVFDDTISNRTIYQKTTLPLVNYMFEGGKSTCFAYGQTGSGKTYTMLDANHGLYAQATADIFRLLNQNHYAHLQAWVGYYEIYQGQLYDLLNGRKLLVPREDGKGNVVIAGLKEHRIHSSDTMMHVFDYGNRERTTSKTKTNDTSSRSHAILQILLKSTNNNVHGKLNFIDLAGSERGTDRDINSDTKVRLEGAEINKSLLALKECIRALDKDKTYAPFRGSKLTMVLKDSFIGNSKTCMIATIAPNHSNSDHTLNTLRYADRVKELRGESDVTLEESTIKITANHIKQFMRYHEIQIKGNEEYLRDSKEMIAEISSFMTTETDQALINKKFQQYQHDLIQLFDRKMQFVTFLRNKIKEELEEEEAGGFVF